MSVIAPLWVALLATAGGGALLTGLVTVGIRLLDLRHRNDETRRDNYVALLAALDDCRQALVTAVELHNRARDVEDGVRRTTDELSEAAAALTRARNTARQAVLRVRLFAPDMVDLRVEKVFGDLVTQRNVLLSAAASTELAIPPPSGRWEDLLNEMRRDLGVGALPNRSLGE